MISARHLTRRFGEFTAVDDVSFEVGRGEIFGFLGANGAGKSTTIKMLCGLLPATSGEAEIASIDVLAHPRRVRGSIGYMSQRFSLYLDLTVNENLTFFGGAYELFGRRFRARRDEVSAELGLSQLGDELTGALPMGLRQRLALACALLHQPAVLFLDEPTAGVDPDARRGFWRLIRRLADGGTTLFVTTHYMDEAEYCDRIGLMASGRLAALDTPDALKRRFVPGQMLEVHGAPLPLVRGVDPRFRVEPFGASLHVQVPSTIAPDSLRAQLVHAGAPDAQVVPTEITLEDVFLAVAQP